MGEQSFLVFFIPSRYSGKAKESPNFQRMSLTTKSKGLILKKKKKSLLSVYSKN